MVWNLPSLESPAFATWMDEVISYLSECRRAIPIQLTTELIQLIERSWNLPRNFKAGQP
jgi:hypothetical protein